ncbi:U-box domain-containing protein 13-like [Hibiscus syriacus]|uniref:U-box domain-containing protein 13-like n=1 Tax=Hibiscus syriacus TaxID=106335 RepID=UPI0019245DF9|nr:U-box domain-containing protein 13-like [Hibiscus syriacus]
MEEEKGELVQSLIDAVNQIAPIGDYRCAEREFCNLARRLKLLTPMFEEIRESKEQIPEEIVKALVSLKKALISAKECLRLGREGSKIYLVLERSDFA